MCRGGEGVVFRCRTVLVVACMGNIAVLGGGGVPVFLELLDDVSGHGDVEHSLFRNST